MLVVALEDERQALSCRQGRYGVGSALAAGDIYGNMSSLAST